MNRFLVYLLAAGHGTRAGGPKAWLAHEGKSLLERHIEFLVHHFPPMSIAVSVQEPWLDGCRILHPLVQWVPVDPKASPLGAFQELLAAVPLTKWAFLYHVDMPIWDDELFYTLTSYLPKGGELPAEAIVPMHGGRRGHPILLSPQLCDQLTALDPARDRLDHFLRGRRVHHDEVPHACVVENWNEGPKG